ncbi:MAG: zinc-ribbon domain-containing protein [Deltaproteobacteria bacterium]|nr:zinc-ribbon domain-containing protein [Candidatus Anaeroferrophillacea bacterium]
MLVTCPRCQSTYNLADGLLPAAGSLARVRCSRCGEVFSVVPEMPDAAVAAEVAPAFDVAGEAVAAREGADFPLAGDEAALVPDAAADLSGRDDMEDESPAEFEFEDFADDSEGGADDFFVAPASGADSAAGVDPGTPGPDEVSGPGVAAAAAATAGSAAETAAVAEPAKPERADDRGMVFELADEFGDEFDDLNWDVDLEDDNGSDAELAAATGAAAGEGGAPRETVLDEAGLEFETAGGDRPPVTAPAGAGGGDAVPSPPAATPTVGSRPQRFGRRQAVVTGVMLVVLSLAIWGGVMLWNTFAIEMDKHLTIVGLESRNLIFSPEKRLVVLRGRIHNTASKPVGGLVIRGELLDRENNVIAERRTAGGVTFSDAELESLDDEMVKALENPAAAVPPDGGDLPFMLLFYDYPSAAASFQVILDDFRVGKKGGK